MARRKPRVRAMRVRLRYSHAEGEEQRVAWRILAEMIRNSEAERDVGFGVPAPRIGGGQEAL